MNNIVALNLVLSIRYENILFSLKEKYLFLTMSYVLKQIYIYIYIYIYMYINFLLIFHFIY